jgi:1-acyl-sn-glycerol-3-phosphate acyltransferase
MLMASRRPAKRPRWIELAKTLRGALVFALLLATTIILFVPFIPVALLKLMAPTTRLRRRLTLALLDFGNVWGRVIRFIFSRVLGARLEVHGLEDMPPYGRHLVICNHQSWADIPILVQAFLNKTRFPRFFLKYELLWVPIVGFSCWAMDFPFMRRYSAKKLQKRPELKGADVEATRRACAKYQHMPVTVLNFVESTRSTGAKREARNSPYRHLLRPKSGGFAFALEAMEDILDAVLDVTIAYPGPEEPSLWDYCRGRFPTVVIHIRKVEVPADLRQGSYSTDPDYRRRFQAWLNGLWQEKDQRLERLLAARGAAGARNR